MKATTIRFSDEIYAQLEKASKDSGLPINSVVVVACMHWLGGNQAGVLRRGWIRDLVPAVFGRLGGRAYPFEMFSQAAKQVLALAQEEANQAGSRYIATDHLVAGLLRVGGGVARRLLDESGVTLGDVRAGLAEAAGERPGRILPTSRVKRVLEAAVKEAGGAGLARVGTEHLLLGILLVGEGHAAALLEEHGLSPELVRGRLAELGRED